MNSSTNKQLLPPLIGLCIALAIWVSFNAPVIMSKAFYWLNISTISAQPIVDNSVPFDTAIKLDPSKPSVLLIDKINLNAPIVYSEKEINEVNFQLALRNGVVHYPNTALPGENGNVVLFGHSSGAWWSPGNYKYVFTLLDKLAANDVVIIEYQGISYKYKVKNSRVVLPTEVSVLNSTNIPTLTLITCYPVGTNEKRLVVDAEQISPSASFEDSKPRIKSVSEDELPSFLTWQPLNLSVPWENL